MVGFTPHEETKLTSVEYAVAGAISGSLTRNICQPLDVLKIRFQLQLEPIKKGENSKYHGILQATRSIVKEEGLRALWKGHVPAQLLSILYGMAQYSSFEILTRAVWLTMPQEMTTSEWRPLTHSLCGAFSGSIATAVIHPIDVLRTRFVAQGEPKVYSGVADACTKIMQSEGLRGFYKGLTPAVLQIGPQMGLQFGFYSLFTGLWNRAKGHWFDEAPSYVESFACGYNAGVMSKVIIYPLDVVKKRLQVQGFEEARSRFGSTKQYSGLFPSLLKVARDEGIRGLYKGLSPGLLKAGAVAGCNLSFYEEICQAMIYFKHG